MNYLIAKLLISMPVKNVENQSVCMTKLGDLLFWTTLYFHYCVGVLYCTAYRCMRMKFCRTNSVNVRVGHVGFITIRNK